MPANTVQGVTTPGVTLAPPLDGRINGYGFAGDVVGVATGAVDEADGLTAGSGQTLWVFGLDWSADITYDSYNSPSGVTSVAASLSFDGQQLPLQLTQAPVPSGGNAAASDSGDQYFVASVPSDAPDVTVALSSSGFTQTFSLTHMTREGTQPAPLYRTPGAWETVDQTDTSRTLVTPYQGRSTSLPNSSLEIDLPNVTLSEFGPAGASDTAPAGEAWLRPELSDPYSDNGNSLYYRTPLIPAQLTLQVPGRPAIHPTVIPAGPDNPNTAPLMNDLFPDQFAFLVPAGITTASLAINPGTQTVIIPGSAEQDTVTVPPASFQLTIPAPATPSPPDGASATPAVIPTIAISHIPVANSPASGGHRPGASSFPTALLIGALLALAGLGTIALVVTRARRRPRPAPAAAGPPWTFDPQAGSSPVANGAYAPSTPYHPDTAPQSSNGWHTATAHTTATGPVAAPSPPPAWSPPADLSASLIHAEPQAGSAVADVLTADNNPPVATPTTTTPAPVGPPTRSVLIPVPEGPPALVGGQIRILVLGRPDAEGLPAPLGETHQEILSFLALHPGERFTTEQLRGRLRPSRGSGDFGERTIPRYMSHLRGVCGVDRIPDNSDSGGYQARGIDSDLAAFNRSLRTAAQTAEPVGRATHLADALSWVRATPFFEAPKGRYGWAETDDELSSDPCNAILQAAIELARLAIDHQDRELADWATGQGLKVWPTDEAILELVLEAAALAGITQLDAAWKRMQARLKANDAEPSDRLQSRYHQVRNDGR